jgi:hypothetical protein
MGRNRTKGVMLLFAAFAALGAVSSAYGRGLTESDVAYAGPMLDNVLAGIAARDYAKFSRDFSATMRDGATETGFPAVVAALEEKLGGYSDRRFLRAGKTRTAMGMLTVVTYQARYSKDERATIMIWISENNGERRIEGFSATPSGGGK